MANSPQARKRARQNEKHRLNNASQRSTMRSAIKTFLKDLSGGDVNVARSSYQKACAQVDRAARKGLHHPNRAARIKSRLNTRLRALAAESGSPPSA